MSRTTAYKGYAITSSPVHDTQTDEWRLSISIAWERNGNTISQPYWIPISYSSETEADIHGVAFGQRIIDGKIPGITVSNE